jgi:hypothetical protein
VPPPARDRVNSLTREREERRHLHRSIQLLRSENGENRLGVHTQLRTEATANKGADDVNARVFGSGS